MSVRSGPESAAAREERLRASARAVGQAHVFDGWGQLDAAGRAGLLDQLDALDLEGLAALQALLRSDPAAGAPPRLDPPEVFPLRRSPSEEEAARAARAHGQELLRAGKVGYLLVAGGQASRLGYDGPKGAYRLGPVSGWSLFEIHARRLRAAARRHEVAVPWYVMTSRANDAATRAFFAEHGHFGLDPADVRFFSQAMMPAMDAEGRLLLSGPGTLFLAPNGHGGVLAALRDSGALDDAARRGLEQLSYFQVDNPLSLPADTLFLGLHQEAEAGMSSKVVAKRDAAEKVGVIGRIDGRMGCIEYSDLPPALREARDERGELLYGAGNIAAHVLALDFVGDLTAGELRLPWHLARKEMSVWSEGAERRVQGVKFETFVFDALAESDRSVTLEVAREREFTPVKNREGSDSPASARADLCRLHASWVAAAGLELPAPGPDGVPAVEVDPLVAEDEAGFRAAGPPDPRVTERGLLFSAG
jgi:UDP-N-acetylglucosamine/UDP-N-acetylgalactosamine diphosphorylase